MDKEKLEGLLIDYIDGTLNESDQVIVKHQLAFDPEARLLYEQLREVMGIMDAHGDLEPDVARLRHRFQEYLESEASTVHKIRPARPVPQMYRIAAAVALVLTGVGIGYWLSWQQKRENEMAALRREIELTKQIVIDKLGNEQSAGQRILGVRASFVLDEADSAITNALIHVMNNDPNGNVRLSAIDALKRYHQEPVVRAALISALSTQTDPVIQIALIHLMVEMKEREAIGPLREITTDVNILQAVKDEAYAGIFKLS